MKYDRVFNFASGPSTMPVEVLEAAHKDFFNYKGCGMSVMEMSHRSPMFTEIFADAQALLRKAMNVPDNYKILFMQGGASLQFSALPLNLHRNGKADYVVTGHFSNRAAQEGVKYTDVHIAGSSKDSGFDHIPSQSELDLDPSADFVHICFNNTAYGTKFPYIPEAGDVPLVADLSSCILSEPVDVSKFGIIYAGVQKNIAPAALVVVIIREDLLDDPQPCTPLLLSYKVQAENNSKYNTPPCWTVYMMKLMLEHLLATGGVEEMYKRNLAKAELLYNYLDSSKLFHPTVQPGSRSIMNVTFRTGNDELDAKFIKEAGAKGLSSLKGHPIAGGIRASIYNSMPIEGVQALVEALAEFEKENA